MEKVLVVVLRRLMACLVSCICPLLDLEKPPSSSWVGLCMKMLNVGWWVFGCLGQGNAVFFRDSMVEGEGEVPVCSRPL